MLGAEPSRWDAAVVDAKPRRFGAEVECASVGCVRRQERREERRWQSGSGLSVAAAIACLADDERPQGREEVLGERLGYILFAGGREFRRTAAQCESDDGELHASAVSMQLSVPAKPAQGI